MIGANFDANCAFGVEELPIFLSDCDLPVARAVRGKKRSFFLNDLLIAICWSADCSSVLRAALGEKK